MGRLSGESTNKRGRLGGASANYQPKGKARLGVASSHQMGRLRGVSTDHVVASRGTLQYLAYFIERTCQRLFEKGLTQTVHIAHLQHRALFIKHRRKIRKKDKMNLF